MVGKKLSYQDSLIVKDLFLLAIREKTSSHLLLAQDYFKRILELDHTNHATLYELAQLAYNNNQVDEAKEYIEQAITINSENPYYWLLSANIYQQQKNYILLNYALDNLIRLKPDKSEYLFDKANALFLSNQLKESLNVYTKLEQLEGLNDELLAAKQRIYLKTGEIDKAAADLESLINQDSSHIKYYLLLAQLYHANDFDNKALSTLYHALKQQDDNHEVLLSIYDILNSKKEESKAYPFLKRAFLQKEMPIDQEVALVVKYFEQFPDTSAINKAKELAKISTLIHPADAKSFSLYGDVLFQDNKMDEAEIAYEKAIEINSSVFAVWDQLIRIKLSLNHIESALKTAEKALGLFPNQASLYYYIGVCYHQTKQWKNALDYYKQALDLEIDDNVNSKSQILSSIGDVYQQLKNFKQSEEAYNSSLSLQPHNSYTLNNYAYYLSLRNEHLNLAEEMAKKATTIMLNNASYEDTYAWVLFKLKKYAEAKIWIEKSLEHSQQKSGILFEHYGDILYHLNDINGALINWKNAFSIDSKNAQLKKKINEKKYLD